MTADPVYIISGLGVDERVFRPIDFGHTRVVFVHWVPVARGETLSSYAAKLREQILTENPVLLGLSFGGMMAVELAKLMPVRKVIQLASVRSAAELPLYYRLAGSLGLHKLIPGSWLKKHTRLMDWFFGAEQPEHRLLLKQILQDTDPVLLRWAIGRILRWDNDRVPPGLISIHGTADHILPFRFVACDIPVPGAGHLMTLTHAREISALLQPLLQG